MQAAVFAESVIACVNVYVPADVIWVSLDGLKQTHDRLRSESFDRVWENLKTATHPKILVHYTINRENWHELDALLEKLKEARLSEAQQFSFSIHTDRVRSRLPFHLRSEGPHWRRL